MRRLRGQPLLEVWLLQGAQLDAAVDVFDGVLEGKIGGGDLVRGEELFTSSRPAAEQKLPVELTSAAPNSVVSWA